MGVADHTSVSHHRWDRIPEEPLKGTITRRRIRQQRVQYTTVIRENLPHERRRRTPNEAA